MGTLAAARRGLHRYAADRVLDGYARHCGLPSGIGRLCLLDDQVLAKVVQTVGIPPQSAVLDIGCGRRFLARWLLWHSISCRYVGVDSTAEVLGARSGSVQKYERIFAIENAAGIVSDGLANCLQRHLAPNGQYVVTLASFDDRHEAKIARSLARLQKHTTAVHSIDLTQQVREFAATLYSAFLLGTWEARVKTHVLHGAASVLHAVESGAFNYTLLTGSV